MKPCRFRTVVAHPILIGRADGVVARVERKTYSPHAKLPRHVHGEAKILCVLAGGFVEVQGRHRFECSRGMMLLRGPGEPHSNDCGPRGADCLAITLSGERLSSDRLLASVFAEPRMYRRAPAHAAMRIDVELSRGDPAAALTVEGLALELLAAAIRGKNPKTRAIPKSVRDAHAAFEAEFTTPIRVADVAALVGVHPVYLARAFRAYFGYSPSELVRLRRLEHAARALRETTRSVSQIALDSGFASPSHFSTGFARHMGLTPSAYRTAARH
jgi:AraC family transcriptional regulator